MEFMEHGQNVHYYDWRINDSPGFRWHEYQTPSWRSMGPWGYRSSDSDYSVGSPRTPLPRTDVLGKYITIQPRSVDTNFRDKRMLVPITKKRKGNNRYGQSGSQRCARCQKGKRKVRFLD
jgi:hypothetical protein